MDPLKVVLRKLIPDNGVKLKLLMEVATPLTVTWTFCEGTWPPDVALNVTWLGFAATPLLLPPLTVRLTAKCVAWPPLAVTVISPV